ncbi:hypothetical protein [Georgenia sp. AZ-5]|uniref:hypothetical protein n=1 Tax=Georgenia sp. AZ-5 TaxID=3367526 RepID=UPI0037550456
MNSVLVTIHGRGIYSLGQPVHLFGDPVAWTLTGVVLDDTGTRAIITRPEDRMERSVPFADLSPLVRLVDD